MGSPGAGKTHAGKCGELTPLRQRGGAGLWPAPYPLMKGQRDFSDRGWFSAAPPGLGSILLDPQGSATQLSPLRLTLGYDPSSLRDWNPYLECVSEFHARN